MGEIYRIVRDGQGCGGFLCPPGHPALFYTMKGWWSAGNGKPRTNREPNSIGGVGDHKGSLEGHRFGFPQSILDQADKLHDEAQLVCSPDWVATVYGYFRNSYSPDGVTRRVDEAGHPETQCICGFQGWTAGKLERHLSEKAGLNSHGRKPLPPPEYHLGYMLVKSYFPDHEPDLDLIAGKGILYGMRECAHCGTGCQYEPRFDGWAPFGKPADCEKSPTGRHEIAR